jgi:hypothetical protein
MRTFTIPGFPDVHPRIELPDIAELLVQPMHYKWMRICFASRGRSPSASCRTARRC